MKIKQILLAFLFTALVVSCGGDKAKDIDVSELKTACEVIDAMIIVMNEVVALGESVDSEEGASDAQKKEFKSLEDLMNEIGEKGDDMDMDDEMIRACPNFYKILEVGPKIEEIGESF